MTPGFVLPPPEDPRGELPQLHCRLVLVEKAPRVSVLPGAERFGNGERLPAPALTVLGSRVVGVPGQPAFVVRVEQSVEVLGLVQARRLFEAEPWPRACVLCAWLLATVAWE
jgi:hypothetical protein